jgi:uncharacterized protein YndB with AHSA1/START domain
MEEEMKSENTPVAVAEMLIRRPVETVFAAFVDPAITTKFWFTRGSARLDSGGPVRWDWAMYGVSADVLVDELVANEKILIRWGDPATTVEWRFDPRPDGTTFVSVRNWGFVGDAESRAGQAIGSTEGFTLVLAGAKAWLEHGLALGLIRDRYPDGLPKE